MDIENYNITRKFKQITFTERLAIEQYLKEKKTKSWIAKTLNRSRKTIQLEIKKGTVYQIISDYKDIFVYKADTAHLKYLENLSQKGPLIKLSNIKVVKMIEDLILEKYSPYAALVITKREYPETDICLKTLYNYIDKGIFLNISNKDLVVKRLRKNKKKKIVRRKSFNNLKGESIENRANNINTRSTFAHWEMDTVEFKKGKNHNLFLVMTERTTRYEVIKRIKNKDQKEVINALNQIEKKIGTSRFKKVFQTITVDNGSEFLNFEAIENSIIQGQKRTKVYYSHPGCAFERGSNENANKLIRRFFPKSSSINKITQKDIKYLTHWINNYPRKLFKDYSSMEFLNKKYPQYTSILISI